MNKGEIIELKIEKLTYGGEGIGRADGIAVFVPDTAAGDVIKAEVVSVKKNMAKATVKEIITSSESRVKPFCPLANACGGCQWQHITYNEQLRAKKKIVEECMRKIAGIDVPVKDVIGSDEVTEYRCKVQYPVQQTKVSKRFLAGYYRKNTHDIVNIKFCPIQPRIIDDIAEFLRKKAQELNLTAYNEKTGKGLIRHFVFRYSQTNKDLLLTVVINDKQNNDIVEELCFWAKKQFPEIKGVLVNFNTCKSNLIMGSKTELVEGQDFIEEVLGEKNFRISAESFFQVNPLTAEKMFSEVRKIIENRSLRHQPCRHSEEQSDVRISRLTPQDDEDIKPSILDVYAGSGSFSMFVSDLASEITAVEESESSVKDGLENLQRNKINNISFIKGDAESVLKKLEDENKKFDVVILDPPRKGCSEQVIESVKNLAGNLLIYISCNPSTLARDVKLLNDKFTPEFIQPVDMFCHTYHVESILVMTKR